MLCLSRFELYSRWVPLLKLKFKFIYSHLLNYNATAIRKKEEVKTELTIK